MTNIPFSTRASVIDYALAREMIHSLGFGARREGDYLVVLRERTGVSLYSKPQEGEEVIGRFYVDEGFYSDTLSRSGLGINAPWMELIDATDFFKMVVRVLQPDVEIDPGNFIGRGFAKSHIMGQVGPILTKLVLTGQLPGWRSLGGIDAVADRLGMLNDDGSVG